MVGPWLRHTADDHVGVAVVLTFSRPCERTESLLANILPPRIAARLKDEEVIADRYDAAPVLFADMAGFTARASDTDPDELVRFLNDVFTRLDALAEAPEALRGGRASGACSAPSRT